MYDVAGKLLNGYMSMCANCVTCVRAELSEIKFLELVGMQECLLAFESVQIWYKERSEDENEENRNEFSENGIEWKLSGLLYVCM